jgi:phosphatidylserine decarboxylase
MKQHFTTVISQNFGKFAQKEFPRTIQNIINHGYVQLMGLNMQEFHSPSSFSSLNALFTRHLKETRAFSRDAEDFISPCDARVTSSGALSKELALQIKGMSYNVDELLGDYVSAESKRKMYDGNFINLYLSPKDYHRYHMPTNCKIIKAIHIPGKLYPVNIPSLKKQLNLFIENERVVIECLTHDGKTFFMVLVGALNVGKMIVSFEERIKTNTSTNDINCYEYEDLHLNKGDDFGCFEMGSTIVIVAQKDLLDFDLETDCNVKQAQTISKIH